jgi:hypothetical protein
MVRGREVPELLGQRFGPDQALTDFGPRLHGCGQRGFSSGAAAQEIDEGVLEARADLLPSGLAGNFKGCGIGSAAPSFKTMRRFCP